jgi:DNA primase
MQRTPAGIDLDSLKQAIRITDLAKTLGLQVRGKQARCFNTGGHKHADKSPSLGLDLETNRFKCFACGVKGSVIDLYKEVKGVDTAEAIRELAKRAGICTQQARPNHKEAPRQAIFSRDIRKDANSPKGQERAVFKGLRDYCGAIGQEAVKYLTGKTRGLTRQTIERFKVFSINDYAKTNNYLKATFRKEDLQRAGLLSDEGNLIFYRHKIIVPFYDDGEIIFLQGRRTDQEHPRYLHIKKEVPLFNTDTLKTMQAGDRVYLCEGVFDAMILEQEGFKAVAILGVNNLKPEMTDLFKGLEVVLCLDNDEAGKEATKQVARAFALRGQEVYIKQLPAGIKDITEYFTR